MSYGNYSKINKIRTGLLIVINKSLHSHTRIMLINSKSPSQLAQIYESFQIFIDNPIITGYPIRMGSRRNISSIFQTPEKENKCSHIQIFSTINSNYYQNSIKSKKKVISNEKKGISPYNTFTYNPQEKCKETEEEIMKSQKGYNSLKTIFRDIKLSKQKYSRSTTSACQFNFNAPQQKKNTKQSKRNSKEEIKEFICTSLFSKKINECQIENNSRNNNKEHSMEIINLLSADSDKKEYHESDEEDSHDNEDNITDFYLKIES